MLCQIVNTKLAHTYEHQTHPFFCQCTVLSVVAMTTYCTITVRRQEHFLGNVLMLYLTLTQNTHANAHTKTQHTHLYSHIHTLVYIYSQSPGMSEKNSLMVRPSLLICRLSWHWQRSLEVPWPLRTHTHTHTHTHSQP